MRLYPLSSQRQYIRHFYGGLCYTKVPVSIQKKANNFNKNFIMIPDARGGRGKSKMKMKIAKIQCKNRRWVPTYAEMTKKEGKNQELVCTRKQRSVKREEG